MTETHPPRLAEAILESFGATPEFRDAVIGDLAQEHAQRVERYGERAARLWYYRQAAAACPALLRNWLTTAGWADARRMLNVAGLAYVLTMVITIGTSLLIIAVGGRPFHPVLAGSPWLQWGSGMLISMLGPICAGYFAASFEKSKPMAAAAALAFIWGVFIIAGVAISVVLPPPAPGPIALTSALRILNIPIIAACCFGGGVLRIRRVSALRVAATSSTPS